MPRETYDSPRRTKDVPVKLPDNIDQIREDLKRIWQNIPAAKPVTKQESTLLGIAPLGV